MPHSNQVPRPRPTPQPPLSCPGSAPGAGAGPQEPAPHLLRVRTPRALSQGRGTPPAPPPPNLRGSRSRPGPAAGAAPLPRPCWRPAPPQPRVTPCPCHPQDIILKRAADIAEALYSVPRAPAQLSSLGSHGPGAVMGVNSFGSQLAVNIGDSAQGPEQGGLGAGGAGGAVGGPWGLRAVALPGATSALARRLLPEHEQRLAARLRAQLHAAAGRLRRRLRHQRLRGQRHGRPGGARLPQLPQRLHRQLPLRQ